MAPDSPQKMAKAASGPPDLRGEQLLGEDDAREDEEVLDPLPRAQ